MSVFVKTLLKYCPQQGYYNMTILFVMRQFGNFYHQIDRINPYSLCRATATTIELCKPLVDALIANWNCTKFPRQLLDPTLLNTPQYRYNVLYEY